MANKVLTWPWTRKKKGGLTGLACLCGLVLSLIPLCMLQFVFKLAALFLDWSFLLISFDLQQCFLLSKRMEGFAELLRQQ